MWQKAFRRAESCYTCDYIVLWFFWSILNCNSIIIQPLRPNGSTITRTSSLYAIYLMEPLLNIKARTTPHPKLFSKTVYIHADIQTWKEAMTCYNERRTLWEYRGGSISDLQIILSMCIFYGKVKASHGCIITIFETIHTCIWERIEKYEYGVWEQMGPGFIVVLVDMCSIRNLRMDSLFGYLDRGLW